MAERFEDLGIAAELVAGAGRAGWEQPTALQAAAIPVIRRGNNVVLHASTGAGVTGAYGLGVLDRLASDADPVADSVRILILTPAPDDASAAADVLALLAAPTRISVRAAATGWPERPSHVLAMAVDDAAAALRKSELKLDQLVSFVLAGADRVAALEGGPALETVLEAVPPAAQRVVATGRFDQATADLVERHARRAMTIPPRSAAEEEGTPAERTATVQFVVVPEPGKASAAAQLLSAVSGGETAVICRTPERVADVAAALAGRGVPVAGEGPGAGEARVLVLPWLEADRRSTRADVLSYDVPFDADTLAVLHGRGGSVLVTPGELAHLRLIARRAGMKLKPVKVNEPAGRDATRELRDRLRQIALEADLSADLALIEPLLADLPAAEVAAAATYLARTARAAPADSSRHGGPAMEQGTGAGAQGPGTGAPPPATAWTRLFVSAGSRDGVGPGDLVGAIAGDAGIPGDQVGKIEVRESHSTVEVPAPLAAAVIQALNGRSLRGRSLRVDYDRKDRPQGRSPGGARSAPRTGGGRGAPGRGGPDRSGGRGDRTGGSRGGAPPRRRGPGRPPESGDA